MGLVAVAAAEARIVLVKVEGAAMTTRESLLFLRPPSIAIT